uniref:Uncharacterized protein n=1 Tax=Peronospora matthiolae TaxID=2874970 RepID=A0AAV1VA38_9STRA
MMPLEPISNGSVFGTSSQRFATPDNGRTGMQYCSAERINTATAAQSNSGKRVYDSYGQLRNENIEQQPHPF